jgi:hypothetical protein
MKAVLDGKTYLIDLGAYARMCVNVYKHHSGKITLSNNKVLDFSKKSLFRIAVKSLVAPILLPMLEEMYKAIGKPLPKPEKHADLIDYAMEHMANFIIDNERGVTLGVTTQNTSTGEFAVTAIAPISEQQLLLSEKAIEQTEEA